MGKVVEKEIPLDWTSQTPKPNVIQCIIGGSFEFVNMEFEGQNKA